MSKSADAFRTISEVADWLGIPAHVLRFWESKFTQVKPVKRAGGRRYYRPADMQLLGGIRKLLHDEGMTIKGVQKIMREQGVRHVAAMSPPLDADLAGDLKSDSDTQVSEIALDVEQEEAPRGQVVNFGRPAPGETEQKADAVAPKPEAKPSTEIESPEPPNEPAADPAPPAEPADEPVSEIAAPEPPAPHDDSRAGADVAAPSDEPREETSEPEATQPAPIIVQTPDDPPDTVEAPASAIRLVELARTRLRGPDPEIAARYNDIAARLASLRLRMTDGRKSS